VETIATVLRTQRWSPSISYRVYRESVGTQPFLSWWTALFRSRFPDADLYIHAPTRNDKAELEAIVGGSVPVLYTETSSRLHDFARIAAELGRSHVAFIDSGVVFSPNDILAVVRSHHLRHVNNYTPVLGFPPGTFPQIYDAKFVIELSTLQFPNANDPAEIVDRLVSGSKAMGVNCPFSIQAIPFDAARHYEVDFDLPENIMIEDSRAIEIVRRLIAPKNAGWSRADGFKLWRQRAVEVRAEKRQQAVELASRTFPRITHNNNPKRILFVSNPAGFSGAEESLCQLISHIDVSRFKSLALLGGEGTFADRLRSIGVDVRVCNDFGYDSVEHMLNVAALFSELRPDLIHFNALSGFPPLYASAIMQLPIVTHCRNAHMVGFEELVRFSDRIIAVSEFERRRVLSFEIPDNRINVIYDEVDSEQFERSLFDRQLIRRKIGVPEAAKLVLMIARFVPNKRHDLLLSAVKQLKPRIPDLHLILKGDVFLDSATYDDVLTRINQDGMRDWVTIIPFVDDIRELHSAADVLVLCSDDEALGRCVVEAMAMETPVVVTSSGGACEIVKHRDTGLVVPRNDVAALTEQLNIALSDEVLCQQMTSAARRYVETYLDSRVSARRVMSLYDDLFATRLSQQCLPTTH
jgi:glycosyltransferase involved in cell wall biosynthesis